LPTRNGNFVDDRSGARPRVARFGGSTSSVRPGSARGFKRLSDLHAIRQRATESRSRHRFRRLAWHLSDRDAVERRPVLAPQVPPDRGNPPLVEDGAPCPPATASRVCRCRRTRKGCSDLPTANTGGVDVDVAQLGPETRASGRRRADEPPTSCFGAWASTSLPSFFTPSTDGSAACTPTTLDPGSGPNRPRSGLVQRNRVGQHLLGGCPVTAS